MVDHPSYEFQAVDEAEAEERRERQQQWHLPDFDDPPPEGFRLVPIPDDPVNGQQHRPGMPDFDSPPLEGHERLPIPDEDGPPEGFRRLAEEPARANGGAATSQPPVRILSSSEFVAGFVPPDYVLEGVLQRRFLYSLTGKTGAGKTAILLLVAAHVDAAKQLAERSIEKGRVLYLAGENADDVRMRWIAMAQQLGFDVDQAEVFFIAGAFKISMMLERIRTEIARIGEVTLIIVDTSAAFFEGDAENDNVQLGNHARLLRKLIDMPGHPCVVVACHPAKNADDSNLIPRGGGAFLAEIDGNLTARADASGVEVGTQGKFRGPDFAPLHFQLRTVTHERLKDSKGRLIPTVVASPLSEQAREDLARVARSKEDELLIALLDPANREASQTELARRLGWMMRDGQQPYHVLVGRVLKTLKAEKLVTVKRGANTLTEEGKNVAESLVQKNRVEPELFRSRTKPNNRKA